MLGTALFFDALQAILAFIPYVGWIIAWLVGIFAWLTFYVWTSIKGWGLSDTVKRIVVQWALPLAELTPLGIFPIWTARVILQLSFLKAEDVLYNSTKGKADVEKITHFYKNTKEGNFGSDIKERRISEVGSVGRITPMSRDKFDERRRNQKIELDKKTELEKKETETRSRSQEAWRDQNRKFVNNYGGQEKYDRDLYTAQNKYLKPGERGVIKS